MSVEGQGRWDVRGGEGGEQSQGICLAPSQLVSILLTPTVRKGEEEGWIGELGVGRKAGAQAVLEKNGGGALHGVRK